MGTGRPSRKRLTDDEKALIADAIREGKPRNEIARQFGRSSSTITLVAKEFGLSFDRSKTKEATEAKHADNAARLERLKTRFLEEAETALDEMHAETKSLKWHEGELLEKTIDSPTFMDKRNIMWRAGGAVRNYLEIDQSTGGGDTFSDVDAWLEQMAGP